MRKALFASAALAAVLVLPASVAAQTPDRDRSQTAPGQTRPDVSTPAPGRSETAPGQNRPSNTPAPGRSESAPGQTRSDSKTDRKPSQAERPGATQGGQRSGQSSPGQNKTDSTSGTTAPPKTGSSSQPDKSSAQENSRTNTRNGTSTSSTTTNTDAEGRRGRAAADVKINQQQEQRLSSAFDRLKARPTKVNINVQVGAVIRERVTYHPLPASIVEIVPQFRGYSYIVVRDEIVIVEPRTRRVVYIMPRHGGHAALRLSSKHRALLKQKLRGPKITEKIEVRDGIVVPAAIDLRPIDQSVVVEVPAIRPYRYFVVEDEVVLVDPNTRRVVEVIE